MIARFCFDITIDMQAGCAGRRWWRGWRWGRGIDSYREKERIPLSIDPSWFSWETYVSKEFWSWMTMSEYYGEFYFHWLLVHSRHDYYLNWLITLLMDRYHSARISVATNNENTRHSIRSTSFSAYDAFARLTDALLLKFMSIEIWFARVGTPFILYCFDTHTDLKTFLQSTILTSANEFARDARREDLAELTDFAWTCWSDILWCSDRCRELAFEYFFWKIPYSPEENRFLSVRRVRVESVLDYLTGKHSVMSTWRSILTDAT